MNKDDFNIDSIIKILKNILNDKKKKQFLLLIFIVIIIIFLLGRNNSNVVETNISNPDLISYESESNSSISDVIYVDISGEVLNPGVYKVTNNTRLFEVIELAGGLTDDADIDSLNQAEIVYDGQKIIINSYNENIIVDNNSSSSQNGKISINNADSTLLQTLPGIGPTKSQNIIDYRNKNGKFKNIEDIKKVSGIGDATFEAIKDLICL